jgi:hypothetical protein
VSSQLLSRESGSGGSPQSLANMTEVFTHRLNVRDKAGLLHRLMGEFIGGWMSLEGDLSKCGFPKDIVVTHDELGVLKRGMTGAQGYLEGIQSEA